jgi:hypothetical protein
MEIFIQILHVAGISHLVQILHLLAKSNLKPLTVKQSELCQSIFKDSLDTQGVLIDESAYLGPKQWDIVYVGMNCINSYGGMSVSIFVHELVHILQYRKYGLAYICRCLFALHKGSAYDFGGKRGARLIADGKKTLNDLNFEAQAALVESAFRWTYLSRSEDSDLKEMGKTILAKIDEI